MRHPVNAYGDSFDLRKGVFQGVGVAVDRLGSHKPVALTGCRDTDFAAELVPLVCFAFADAFYCWLVDTVDLVFVFSLLVTNSGRDVQ